MILLSQHLEKSPDVFYACSSGRQALEVPTGELEPRPDAVEASSCPADRKTCQNTDTHVSSSSSRGDTHGSKQESIGIPTFTKRRDPNKFREGEQNYGK